MYEPSQHLPYPTTFAQIAWVALLTIVTAVHTFKKKPIAMEPVIIRKKKPKCKHEEMIRKLQKELDKKQTCTHEETIETMYKELCEAKRTNDELVHMLRKEQEEKLELQQELCLGKMNHEDALDDLHKERCLAEKNHDEKINELHRAYFEAGTKCKEFIASLQLELYHAKLGQTIQQVKPTSRVESILLHKLDSKGISDENILKCMRIAEPRLRRADIYNSLRALQSKGLVRKQANNAWIKISQTQSSSTPPYYQDCKY